MMKEAEDYITTRDEKKRRKSIDQKVMLHTSHHREELFIKSNPRPHYVLVFVHIEKKGGGGRRGVDM